MKHTGTATNNWTTTETKEKQHQEAEREVEKHKLVTKGKTVVRTPHPTIKKTMIIRYE